jgi:hypothetical protein
MAEAKQAFYTKIDRTGVRPLKAALGIKEYDHNSSAHVTIFKPTTVKLSNEAYELESVAL